ncbi:MAG TPA: sulfatase-like hydrolase/transferase [Planctomycetota bacterium]
MRWQLSRVLLAFLAAAAALAARQDPRPPNVVFLLADDLGWADLGSYGSTFYETPNLDRLAASGMRFTQAYAACPVCSPTRASILAGKYPARMQTTDWFGARRAGLLRPAPYVDHLPLEEVTLAEAFAAAGYRTAFLGKWHLGGDGYLPEDQGFEVNVGGHDRGSPPGGYFAPFANPKLDDGPDGEQLTDRLTDEALALIEEFRAEPFLVYLSYYAVHTPLQTKPDLEAKYAAKAAALPEPAGPRWLPERERKTRQVQDHAVYAGMVQSLDESVGRILDKLEELGLDANTVIVFTSDNGGLSTSEGHPTSNLPLRAGKGWLYEGGVREPAIVRWPGVTRAGSTSATPFTSTDYYPTLLEIAGLPAQPQQHVDGISLAPLLRGAAAPAPRDLFWHYPHYGNQGGAPSSAIRSGDWKLIHWYEDDRVELFDLRADPGEKTELSAQYSAQAERLMARLRKWREDTGVLAPTPNSDFGQTFERLFNGRDLSGWVNVNGAPETWTVRDGMIVCSGKPICVLRTERMYENFVLEMEWKHLVPKGNAGLFVWSDPVTARGQPFTRSIEVQILDGRETPDYTSHGDVFSIHGARMTPDRPHPGGWERCLPSEKRCKPAGEWNHYRVTARNGTLKLEVNGVEVAGGYDIRPRKGYLCLESEGSEVHFRNLRIRELPPSGAPLSAEMVAEEARGFRSLYNGIDLRDWKRELSGTEHWRANDWRIDGDSDGGPLWHQGKFGDFEMIVDWRADSGGGIPAVFLRGDRLAWTSAESLQLQGQWNRTLLTLRGERVTVDLNGERIFDGPVPDGTPASGSIGLLARDGAVQFANVYLRELGEAPAERR